MISGLPIKKQAASEVLVSSMEGPTFPKASPMFSSTDFLLSTSRPWYVWTNIKILSTPTANTKNGITWKFYYLFVIMIYLLK